MPFKLRTLIPKSGQKKSEARDKIPEGAEHFFVAHVPGAPHAKVCQFEMDSYFEGEAALGLLEGVLATQVGSTIGSPQTVRVCGCTAGGIVALHGGSAVHSARI